jgi:hypothetical protein
MAKTYTLKANLETGTDAPSFEIASYTLDAGAFAYLAIWTRDVDIGGVPPDPTITDSAGRTWTLVNSQVGVSDNRKKLAYRTQNAGATTGTTTIDFGVGQDQRYILAGVVEVTGNVDPTAFVQAAEANGSSTTPAVTLAAFGAAANGTIFSAGGNATITFTEEASWTKIFDGTGGESMDMGIFILDANDTSPTATMSAGATWAAIGVEVEELVGAAAIPIRTRGYFRR